MVSPALQLKEKIHNREFAIGMWCYSISHSLMEFVGTTKLLDFLVFDLEHSPYYADKMVEFIRIAELYGLVPWVRIPSPSDLVSIQKVLDAGAKGIIVPQIRKAEEVRRAVAATKYQPDGTRGWASVVRGTGFPTGEKVAARVKELNNEITVSILPLESKEGISNLEEILSVPGIDCVSLSLGDITMALGHPGEPDHPEIRAVQDKAMRLCSERNIPNYALPQPKPGAFEYWYNKGIRLFTIIDLYVFRFGFTQISEEFRRYKK